MGLLRSSSFFAILLIFVSAVIRAKAGSVYCSNPRSRCYSRLIECPYQCPSTGSANRKSQICHVDCDSPTCKSSCKHCNGPGSACYDPRFVGGDGIVFYFHGKSNEHFSLVSDASLQINGRFIGHRPAGRTRDFTWIQALGILFNSHTFSLEAIKSATWNNEVDHLKFSYNGEDLVVPDGALTSWYSPDKEVKVERVANKNSVIVTLKDSAEIMVNVAPVTKEDDRVHNYKVPSDDCFAHLEVQFRFFALSPNIDGVLGRTYRTDFENPVKPGVAMPVFGGEDKYRTSELLSADCSTCLFSPQNGSNESTSVTEYLTLDCTRGGSSGYGIVCKK
ncbi:receptor-like protein kinase THESEUS 1 [Hibiscus syriacus]|uniref:Receptor-like protein kinase THESEUS 1 n=1 Tax=Hibiscus syriacus TaxID=106335 RepID=A0A6A2ZL46_HIBSY|nr:receptor-like protein kinase THESEUS 1 [Hibiscus syriacus]